MKKTYIITMQLTVGIDAESQEEAIDNVKGIAFYSFDKFAGCDIVCVEEEKLGGSTQ